MPAVMIKSFQKSACGIGRPRLSRLMEWKKLTAMAARMASLRTKPCRFDQKFRATTAELYRLGIIMKIVMLIVISSSFVRRYNLEGRRNNRTLQQGQVLSVVLFVNSTTQPSPKT